MLDVDTASIMKSSGRLRKQSSIGRASFRGGAPSDKGSEKQRSRVSSAKGGTKVTDVYDQTEKIASSLLSGNYNKPESPLKRGRAATELIKSLKSSTLKFARSITLKNEEKFKPEEVPLERPDMTPDDKEFDMKTIGLKDYIRKKMIHAQIFKSIEASDTVDGKSGMSIKR